jgi:hypothetical protein
MKTPDDRKEFVRRLLAQDPPPADKHGQHQDVLFRKIKRRVVRHKVTTGIMYIILFGLAFSALLRQRKVDSITRSMQWGAISLSILLWFLVGFLRYIYRQLAQLAEKDGRGLLAWRQRDRLVTTAAIFVFALQGLLFYRSFSLTDPLLVDSQLVDCYWATMFFILWYAFGTASGAARIWLAHKTMELHLHDFGKDHSEGQEQSRSDPPESSGDKGG